MASEPANVCVFAPTFFLTVMIEPLPAEEGFDDLHFHPGGQGFWIARMLHHLGERPILVTPAGGESGRVLRGLAPAWNVDLSPVETREDSPAYLQDRRSGERRQIARSRLPTLDRHEIDNLYGRVLAHATSTGICVLTGKAEGAFLPNSFYRRLGADLKSIGVLAIGDLHGEELAAFLETGLLHTLKVSDVDLAQDGLLSGEEASTEERLAATEQLMRQGAQRVVLSSARGCTIARFGDLRLSAAPPALTPADHRGSGDAMTAGLVAAALRRLDLKHALQLACAAGAANVTRHGLASAEAGLVESLAKRVEVRELR